MGDRLVGLCLILGLALAVLTIRVRYESFVKSIIFVPMAISATAVAVIWLLVYSPDPTSAPSTRSSTGSGQPGVVARQGEHRQLRDHHRVRLGVDRFAMVVLSAALKGIPTEILEAARVDGAGEWNIFRRIMLPMLSLPISIVTVWLFINVIKVFDIIYVMTSGGPGTSSRVIAYTMYSRRSAAIPAGAPRRRR